MEITHPSETKRLKILVVDDEAGTRSALAAVLKLAGHEASFATDGDEALDMFDSAQVPFQLIITDHAMARVSGLDLVRSLRKRGFTGEVVVLTAYAGTIEEQEYGKLEVAGIMEKPFDLTELRRWLASIHGHQSSPGEKQPGQPGAIDFCWLKHD